MLYLSIGSDCNVCSEPDPHHATIARIRFQDGQPQRFEDFLTGFLVEDGRAFFGRPAGLVMKDSSLLVSDDANGVI